MNHDYAHCMDYQNDCPKDCYRAELTRDLQQRCNPHFSVSWMYFRGTDECKRDGVKSETN